MFGNELFVGGTLLWDCFGTHTPYHVIAAEVLEVTEDAVTVIRRNTIHRGPQGIDVLPVDVLQQPFAMRRSYFEQPPLHRMRHIIQYLAN